MTWELIFLVAFFAISNVGTSYFTTWRMTSESFLRSLFAKRNPLGDIECNSREAVIYSKKLNDDIQSVHKTVFDTWQRVQELEKEITLLKSANAGGYEQLYAALIRGKIINLDEIIEKAHEAKKEEWLKREAQVIKLSEQIAEYGKVILGKK